MSNPLHTAFHVQNMANKPVNDKVALAMTGISVALLSLMLIKEAKVLFREKGMRDHFQKQEKGRGGASLSHSF